MVDYVKLAAVAKRLIEENGRTVTLIKRDRSPADASKPWRGSDDVPVDPDPDPDTTGASVSVIAVLVPPGGSGFGRDLLIDPTLFKDFTQVAIVAATSLPNGTNLEEFDTLVDGARSFRINLVSTLAPGDTTLIYALGLAS